MVDNRQPGSYPDFRVTCSSGRQVGSCIPSQHISGSYEAQQTGGSSSFPTQQYSPPPPSCALSSSAIAKAGPNNRENKVFSGNEGEHRA